MKKSRIFMGIAALSLVVAGVLANSTAKKFTVPNIYYYDNTTNPVSYNALPACMETLFSAIPSLGTQQQARIYGATNNYPLYYYQSLSYHPVYESKF